MQKNLVVSPVTDAEKRHYFGFMTARVMQKMRAGETKNCLRFLPLNWAMEVIQLHSSFVANNSASSGNESAAAR